MTMAEMARIIGVSRITLSKVINGKGSVAPDTEKYIKECLKKYNYVPNSQARALVGKKEPIIGLFTAYEHIYRDDMRVSSNFATEIVTYAVTAAKNRGYNTLLCVSNKMDDFREVGRYISSGLIQGAILLGYESGSKELECLVNCGAPVVLLNQEEDLIQPNISAVNMNDEEWAYYSMKQLIDNNHSRILYITCSRHGLPVIRRNSGVKRALLEYKDKVTSYRECNGEYDEDITYDIVRQIYTEEGSQKPTGIFAANDQMAIGAMRALKSLKIKVPEQVSVIGYDDIPVSKYLFPALTTVHCDMHVFAQKSVGVLIDCIEEKGTACHYEHELEFIVRNTLGYHNDEKNILDTVKKY